MTDNILNDLFHGNVSGVGVMFTDGKYLDQCEQLSSLEQEILSNCKDAYIREQFLKFCNLNFEKAAREQETFFTTGFRYGIQIAVACLEQKEMTEKEYDLDETEF